MGKFFESLETKHLIFGVILSVIGAVSGWGLSQIFTQSSRLAAMEVYVEKHGETLADLSTLPPDTAVIKSAIERLDQSHAIIQNNVHNNTEKIHEHDTRISIIEDQIGQEE